MKPKLHFYMDEACTRRFANLDFYSSLTDKKIIVDKEEISVILTVYVKNPLPHDYEVSSVSHTNPEVEVKLETDEDLLKPNKVYKMTWIWKPKNKVRPLTGYFNIKGRFIIRWE